MRYCRAGSATRAISCVNKGGVAAPTTPGALSGALTADIGVIDLDPRPAGAKLVAAVPLDHRLHQFVLNPPGSIGRNPQAPPQLDVGQPFLALGEQMHGAEPHPHRKHSVSAAGWAISAAWWAVRGRQHAHRR